MSLTQKERQEQRQAGWEEGDFERRWAKEANTLKWLYRGVFTAALGYAGFELLSGTYDWDSPANAIAGLGAAIWIYSWVREIQNGEKWSIFNGRYVGREDFHGTGAGQIALDGYHDGRAGKPL